MLIAAVLFLAARFAEAGQVSFAPTLSSWYEYNDNILLAPDRGNIPIYNDHSLNVQPGAHVLYDSDLTHVRFGGTVSFKWNRFHPEQDGLPDVITADALWSRQIVPQIRTELNDNYSYFYAPGEVFGTSRIANLNQVLTTRTQSIANTATAALEGTVSPMTLLRGEYTFGTTEYKDPALYDVVTHMAMITWRQRASERHTAVTFFRFSRNLYNHEFDFFRRVYDKSARMAEPFPTRLVNPFDFDTWVPGIGLDYVMTPILSFEVRSGMILPANEIRGRYKIGELDWYQRLAATWTWPRWRVTASYTRDLTPAYGLGTAVLNQAYLVNFAQIWTRQFSTYVEGTFSRGMQTVGRIDGYREVAAADYLVFPWLGLGAGYQHFVQLSKVGDINFKVYQNRYIVELSLGAPRPGYFGFAL